MIEVQSGFDSSTELPIWVLTIKDRPIMTLWCNHSAKHFARKLSEARGMPHRDAMRTLTEDLGCCDQFAQSLLFLMAGEEIPKNVH